MKLIALTLSIMIIMFIGCIKPVQALDVIPDKPPTNEDIIKIFPNAKIIDAVGVYLFRSQSLAFGPSYTVAKFKDLVSADIQLAAVVKGGSFAGVGLGVDSVDIWKLAGKVQPDPIRNFPVYFGVTGGYVWTNTEQAVKPGWDGGVRAKVPVDLEKIGKALGL